MKINMQQWAQDIIDAKDVKILPVQFFPTIPLMEDMGVEKAVKGAEDMAKVMVRTIEEYPDLIACMTGMDLTIDTEAFGGIVNYSEKQAPNIHDAVISTPEEIRALQIPDIHSARVDVQTQATVEAEKVVKDRPVFGGMLGPFSLASNLLEVSKALMMTVTDPESMHILIQKATDYLILRAKEYKAKVIFSDNADFSLALGLLKEEISNDWVLILEENEILPLALFKKIEAFIKNPPKNCALASFPIKTFYLNQEVKSFYEKKLLTYPRTDSRYLTDDMADGVNAVVICSASICGVSAPAAILPRQICNSKKVSDHHAIIPTAAASKSDIAILPAGEREIITLIARQFLRAVSEPYRFRETVAVLCCGDNTFTAKGKIVENIGWKAYNEKEQTDKVLPELADGDELKVNASEIKEGTTKPPSHFTEDSLLSAMEVAGAKEMPDDAERKGLGTPATRAGIIEKLITTGFVERKKAKKTTNLIPASTGVSLITVLPEQLQSPLLTAEWEHKLKMVEHGELDADAFMAEISLMVNELVKTYSVIKGAEVLFPSGRDVVGKCPRCGGDVTESKKGFFCETNDCRFGLWRDNKFLTAKKITLSKKMAAALLKDGEIPVKGIFSEKTGKSYDATLVLNDDGVKTVYSLDFDKS